MRDPLGRAEELGVYPKSEGELWKGLRGGGVGQAMDIRFSNVSSAACENGGWGSGRGLGQQKKGFRSRVVGRGEWWRGGMHRGPGRKGTVRLDQPGGVYGRDGPGQKGAAQYPGRPAEGAAAALSSSV